MFTKPVVGLRFALALLLCVNFLDVSTSLFANRFDWLVPNRPLLGEYYLVQVLLVFIAIAWLAPYLPKVAAHLARWPLPKPLFVFVALLFAVQLSHVFFRNENYPFSNVAMFSIGVPNNLKQRQSYVVRSYMVAEPPRQTPRYVSFMLEGSYFFPRLLDDLDYKAGWVLRMYGPSNSAALRWFDARLLQKEMASPWIANVEFSLRDGRITRWGGPVIGLDARGEIARQNLPMLDYNR